jgi:hypothetical protein
MTADLRKLALAAIAEDAIPSANLPVYNFRQHRDAYRVATQPERVLAMIAVIEAAKAVDARPTSPARLIALSAALAALERGDK